MRHKLVISIVISLVIVLGVATQTGSTIPEKVEHPPSPTVSTETTVPQESPEPDPNEAWDLLIEKHNATSTTTTSTTTTTTTPPTTIPVTTVPPTTVPPTTVAPQPVPTQPAPAAPVSNGSVWDRLAQCESGGDWHINTGNGYYGGIQFSLTSWQAVGGTGYPHEHSRATQIEMGERLRAQGGWGHWPACSRQLGLR